MKKRDFLKISALTGLIPLTGWAAGPDERLPQKGPIEGTMRLNPALAEPPPDPGVTIHWFVRGFDWNTTTGIAMRLTYDDKTRPEVRYAVALHGLKYEEPFDWTSRPAYDAKNALLLWAVKEGHV